MSGSILIVGASRGLGLGVAETFLARGWDVAATVRDSAAPPADLAGRARILDLDVRDDAAVARLAGAFAPGALDLVLISAGVMGPDHQAAQQATPDEVADLFLINAVAPVRLARALLPALKPGGKIGFMSSRMGSVALNAAGDMELYRASKAALNSLINSFAAKDAGPRGVGVVALHPGWVQTDMGGAGAPVTVAASVEGLADVLTGPATGFVDYQGNALAW